MLTTRSIPKYLSRTNSIGKYILVFLSIGCTFTANASQDVIPKQAMAYLLDRDWQGVYFELRIDDTVAKEPVNRFLMGHACLATNRNNEAFRLFLTVHSEQDRKAWLSWAKVHLNAHRTPVIRYIYADALARTGEFEAAYQQYTKATNTSPSFSLAYNGRGLLLINQGKPHEASIDFLKAIELNPNLADACANYGNYCVLIEAASNFSNHDAPPLGIRYFNQSLESNPDFALAYNGRGCLLYGCGKFEQAVDDFIRAYTIMPELETAHLNESFALSAASKVCALYQAYDAGKCDRPGMSIATYVDQHNTYQELLKERKQEIQKRQQDLPVLPSNWEQTWVQNQQDRHGEDQRRIDHRSVQNLVIQRITDLEMKIANAHFERQQSLAGLDFASKMHKKLSLIELAATLPKDVLDAYSAFKDNRLKEYLTKEVFKESIKTGAVLSMPNEAASTAAEMTFAVIFQNPITYAVAPAKLMVGHETQSRLSQLIHAKDKEISTLARDYSRQMDHLRRSGIEVYHHQHDITVYDGVDTWKYQAGTDRPGPRITLQTRASRPFWDIAALASHLRDMTKNPIHDYSRTDKRSISMRVRTGPSNTTTIVTDSPATQKIAAMQMGIQGRHYGIMDAPTDQKITQLMNRSVHSVIAVNSGKPPIGPTIQSPTYRDLDHRVLDLAKYSKGAASANIPQLSKYNGSVKTAQPGDIVVRTGGPGTIPHTYTYFGNQKVKGMHFDSIELVRTEKTNQAYIVPKHWTADSGPQQNFYRPLESTQIECTYKGKQTTLADLPEKVKGEIVQTCFEHQVKALGSHKGNYQLPGINRKSNQCTDFTLQSYSKAFADHDVHFTRSTGQRMDFSEVFSAQINIGPVRLESTNPMSTVTTKVISTGINSAGIINKVPISARTGQAIQTSMPQVAAPFHGIQNRDLIRNQGPKFVHTPSTGGGYTLPDQGIKRQRQTVTYTPTAPDIKINIRPPLPERRWDVYDDTRKYVWFGPGDDGPGGGLAGSGPGRGPDGGSPGGSGWGGPGGTAGSLRNSLGLTTPTFTPPKPPMSQPGGISTEDLAKVITDRGNWPVLPMFVYTLETPRKEDTVE